MKVRVRFAPSPTGYLHVGGARTALINWLFARKHGGTFILRIEDTDAARSTPEMIGVILDGLSWLGIDWDEGPFFQSERLELHRSNGGRLLESGNAYRCFCTREEVETRRAAGANPAGWKYDGRCRLISKADSDARAAAGEPFVVRCAVPEGRLEWNDIVKGRIAFEAAEIEDFVILRSDASPTYHLSVVSDDSSMGVTHVIRGEDHISNTPKQIALYHGLNIKPPVFGHLPLILGPDRKKLSKRRGVASVTAYRDEGILPLALFNYLAGLGANLGEAPHLSVTQILGRFSLDALKRSASVFDAGQLSFVNAKVIGDTPPCELAAWLKPFLREVTAMGEPEVPEAAVEVMKTRAHNLKELAVWLLPFLTEEFPYDPKATAKVLKKAETFPALEALLPKLAELGDDGWTPGKLEAVIRGHAVASGVKAGVLIHPCRLFLLGRGESPGIFDVLWAMGREGSLIRLRRGLKKMEEEAAKASTLCSPE